MRRRSGAAGHAILESPDIQLVVHAIPEIIAGTITLFFALPTLAEAQRVAPSLGGEVFDETWEGDGVSCPSCSHPSLEPLPVSSFSLLLPG